MGKLRIVAIPSLALAVALGSSCGGGGSPTTPATPSNPNPTPSQRSFQLSVEVAVFGVPPPVTLAVEVRLLLDGRRIGKARSNCEAAVGCSPHNVTAFDVDVEPGEHQLGVRIMSHTRNFQPFDGPLTYQIMGLGFITDAATGETVGAFNLGQGTRFQVRPRQIVLFPFSVGD